MHYLQLIETEAHTTNDISDLSDIFVDPHLLRRDHRTTYLRRQSHSINTRELPQATQRIVDKISQEGILHSNIQTRITK